MPPSRKKLKKSRRDGASKREEFLDAYSSRNGYQYEKQSEINLPKKKKKIKKKKKTKKKTLFDIIDMDE